MRSHKEQNNLQEKIANWFWIVLLVGAVLYFRDLLGQMRSETSKLSEERQEFQRELKEEREESKELYKEFYAEVNESIKRAIEAIQKGEIPQQNFK